MSTIMGIIILALAPQSPPPVEAAVAPAVQACDLDDCSLSEDLHHVDGQPALTDRWAWMHHDLALARAAARQGQRARAIDIAASLDHAIKANLAQLLIDRGSVSVLQLHATLQALVLDCQGQPLQAVNLSMDPIARSQTRHTTVKTPAQ